MTGPRPIARRRPPARVLAAIALAVGLAGCGSSSTLSGSNGVTIVSTAGAPPAKHARAGTRPDPVHHGTSAAVAHSSSSSEPEVPVHHLNPCTLVSAATASAVTGYPIERTIEGQLGPTCIYVPRGAAAS